MDVVRVYETTIADRELGASLTCVTLPRKALEGLSTELAMARDDPDTLFRALGMEVLDRGWPSNVAWGLLAVLTSNDDDDARRFLHDLNNVPMSEFWERTDRRLGEFAEYVAHAPLIAFEHPRRASTR